MIELDNVSLKYTLDKESIVSLKEYVIKFLKKKN